MAWAVGTARSATSQVDWGCSGPVSPGPDPSGLWEPWREGGAQQVAQLSRPQVLMGRSPYGPEHPQ